MKSRALAVLCFGAFLFAAANASLHAQEKGSGAPPPAPPRGVPGVPGVPSEPGVPGGPGKVAPSITKSPGASAASGGVQFGPVGRWWDDKAVAKTVGLSSEQKKKMDGIFNANKPAILAAYRDFLKQQSNLSAISKDPHADKASTFAAIDAVNQARTALQKATAQMYLEIREQLNPEQVDRVEKMQ